MTHQQEAAVVVARTTDTVASAIWVDALKQEGIPARSVEHGLGPALGGLSGAGHTVILVGQSHVAAARSIIADMDGALALTPVIQREEERAAASRTLVMVGWGVGVALAVGVAVRFLL